MSETNVPAIEADFEVNTYELAFHVLPTVAEGEVSSVVDTIKTHITNTGATIIGEEAPARFDLAYDIVKYLEGRNRKFNSAYFGWVRFTSVPAEIEQIVGEVEGLKEILRSMIIKLNKTEEANPFMFHDSVATKKVENIEVETDEDEEEDEDDSSEEAPNEGDSDADGEDKE